MKMLDLDNLSRADLERRIYYYRKELRRRGSNRRLLLVSLGLNSLFIGYWIGFNLSAFVLG